MPIELWAWFVRYARHDRGLSQHALAVAAGVAQQTVSKVEAGAICPQDGLKVRLAKALNVPTGDLFPWPPRPARNQAEQPVMPEPPAREASDV